MALVQQVLYNIVITGLCNHVFIDRMYSLASLYVCCIFVWLAVHWNGPSRLVLRWRCNLKIEGCWFIEIFLYDFNTVIIRLSPTGGFFFAVVKSLDAKIPLLTTCIEREKLECIKFQKVYHPKFEKTLISMGAWFIFVVWLLINWLVNFVETSLNVLKHFGLESGF